MDNIEKSTKRLEFINQWILNCDTKSSFVLTLFGVLLTIIFTSDVGGGMIATLSFIKSESFSGESFHKFSLLVLTVAFIITSIKTFFHIFSTLKGRIDPTAYAQGGLNMDSNIFFDAIAKKTFQDFETKSNTEDEKVFLNDLNSQIFINASIVSAKFRQYNKSLLWMFISLLIFIVYVVLK